MTIPTWKRTVAYTSLKLSHLDFHRVVFWGGYLILVITRPPPHPQQTAPGVPGRRYQESKNRRFFLT